MSHYVNPKTVRIIIDASKADLMKIDGHDVLPVEADVDFGGKRPALIVRDGDVPVKIEHGERLDIILDVGKRPNGADGLRARLTFPCAGGKSPQYGITAQIVRDVEVVPLRQHEFPDPGGNGSQQRWVSDVLAAADIDAPYGSDCDWYVFTGCWRYDKNEPEQMLPKCLVVNCGVHTKPPWT